MSKIGFSKDSLQTEFCWQLEARHSSPLPLFDKDGNLLLGGTIQVDRDDNLDGITMRLGAMATNNLHKAFWQEFAKQ